MQEHHFKESIIKNNFKVINCEKCGYWHVYPMPTEEELGAYYKNEYPKTFKHDPSMGDKSRDPNGFYRVQYVDRLRRINYILPTNLPKSVIDIGAGCGDFLAFMKENGWDVQGVEPSRDSYEDLKKKDLNIRIGTILKEYPNFSPVSVVTLNNVLEHLREPLETIDIVKKYLLMPKGLISIIVPNEFSILQNLAIRTVLKDNQEKHNYWIDPPIHLNYWSAETIKVFLNNCGFRILYTSTDFPMELFLLLGEDYISNPRMGRRAHLKRVMFEKYLSEAHLENFKDALFKSFAEIGVGRNIHILAEVK